MMNTFLQCLQNSLYLKRALASVNKERNTSYSYLKPLQTKTLKCCLENDVISILPTGYGKSLIFECLPRFVALSRTSSCSLGILLISPLNSIITEQLDRYAGNAININTSFLTELTIHNRICLCTCSCSNSIVKFVTGNFLFCIGHPEHFLNKDLFICLSTELLQEKISHIVVDEAHCIESWGEDFRKDFSKLIQLRSILPKAYVLALTGTASHETISVIKKSLNMKHVDIVQTCIMRENIKLSVTRRPNYSEGSEESFLLTMKPYIKELKEKKELFPRTVVYCNLKWCGVGYEECCRNLSSKDTKEFVAQFHAPCTQEMKKSVVDSMKEYGKTRLLFATEAYSMGTDTPNISRIVHFGVPKSISSYMQEVGRCGRNGHDSEAVMFYNNNDIAKNVRGLDPVMVEFCRTSDCRWQFICQYFGCMHPCYRNGNHMCCDNCSLKCNCDECIDHFRLLSKGLKFIPTRRKVDIGKLITDLKLWERRMRLREYFMNMENDNECENNKRNTSKRKIKPKKTNKSWTPEEGRNKWLDQYIQEVKDDVIKNLKKDFKSNLSVKEEKALKELLNDHSIVIRPSDKGSGIVVLDADKYRDDVETELLDNTTYKQIDENLVLKTENKIRKIIDKMYKTGAISEDMKSYFLPKDTRPGKVQGNPKVHKNNNPLRLIINGQHSITENIAEFIEEELSENVKGLKSYIKDTTDFLNKIKTISQPLPDDAIMFCLDVKALYPSVPRKEAKDSCKDAFNNRSYPKIPTEDALTLMDVVLENNIFSFNNKFYIQTEGTAIGSKLGMNYACTYMGQWEKKLFEISEHKPLCYWR